MILVLAYVVLAFGLTVARLTNRPAGDTTSTLGVVASAIIYLALSLGFAWLLELALRRRAPAAVIVAHRKVLLQHIRSKQKEAAWGQRQFLTKHQDHHADSVLRKQLASRYQRSYDQAKAKTNGHSPTTKPNGKVLPPGSSE